MVLVVRNRRLHCCREAERFLHSSEILFEADTRRDRGDDGILEYWRGFFLPLLSVRTKSPAIFFASELTIVCTTVSENHLTDEHPPSHSV